MPLTETLSGIVLKGAPELITSLVEAYAKRKLDADPERSRLLKSDITPHIDATFRKCSVIKTLLNPLSPANFLSIYATQRFQVAGNAFDHYGMVDFVKNGPQNIILTGTGGSGKSMFTRYLWLSLFVYSDGKIPFFIELRNINTVSTDDFLTYISYSISQGSATLTDKDFRNHLKNGDFVFILDGFDELLQSKKESVQNQIINLAENYPKLKIILTSRPDNSFTSWPSFEVVTVAPLHRDDVIELIEKAEFSEDSKSLFLKRLKDTNLYSNHQSFLTNPLLASMMLLTFSYSFDIPDRMHLFYQQAFDALYQRHDSYKPGGFRRQFKTDLSEDLFKRIICYFCLITYNNEKIVFSRDEAINALENAIKITGTNVDPSDLLDDLRSCVCFLILDGIHYVFSHRSFQEYFTACCMVYLDAKQFEPLVSKFAERQNDQVIALLSDIAPETFRRQYVLPKSREFASQLRIKQDKKSVLQFFENTQLTFNIQQIRVSSGVGRTKSPTSRLRPVVYLSGGNNFFRFVKLIYTLEKSKASPTLDDPKRQASDRKALQAIVDGLKVIKDETASIYARNETLIYFKTRNVRLADNAVEILKDEEQVRSDLDIFFYKAFMHEYLVSYIEAAIAYVSAQQEIEKTVLSTINDLFGIESGGKA